MDKVVKASSTWVFSIVQLVRDLGAVLINLGKIITAVGKALIGVVVHSESESSQ